MCKISAVGLFCCDKFEEIPKQKVIDLSKFKKFYFKIFDSFSKICKAKTSNFLAVMAVIFGGN